MKHLMLCLCGALAVLLGAPMLASAHEPPAAVAAVRAVAIERPSVSVFSQAHPRALVGGARLEQRGRAGRGAVRGGGGSPAGRAMPRSVAPFRRRVFVNPFFFSPFAFGGFGLGFAYDPFFWGWGYPFGWGYPYWGAPYYGYGYGYGDGRYGYRMHERYGSIKLDVKPKDAEVYVDGYYMGQVRDFNGAFHHLDLAGGDHKIEIRENGYKALDLNIKIMPGRTVSYRGELAR